MTRRPGPPVAAWGVVAAAAVLLAAPALAPAFKDGPLPGRTGGFGEPSCHACHFDNAVNHPAGTLQVAGLPASYTAHAEHRIRIVLRRPGARRAGFQLAVRFAGGPRRGEDAGVLEPLDERVQVAAPPDGRPRYAQHTARGGELGEDGESAWTVGWRAPAEARWPVALHVAANAGNGDDSPLGDHVYLAEATSRPR
jgi:hypothetical protein